MKKKVVIVVRSTSGNWTVEVNVSKAIRDKLNTYLVGGTYRHIGEELWKEFRGGKLLSFVLDEDFITLAFEPKHLKICSPQQEYELYLTKLFETVTKKCPSLQHLSVLMDERCPLYWHY